VQLNKVEKVGICRDNSVVVTIEINSNYYCCCYMWLTPWMYL